MNTEIVMTKEKLKGYFPVVSDLIDEAYERIDTTGGVLINVETEEPDNTIPFWGEIYHNENYPLQDCITSIRNEIISDDETSQEVFNQRVRDATFISTLQTEAFKQGFYDSGSKPGFGSDIIVSIYRSENELDNQLAYEIAEMTNILTRGYVGTTNEII